MKKLKINFKIFHGGLEPVLIQRILVRYQVILENTFFFKNQFCYKCQAQKMACPDKCQKMFVLHCITVELKISAATHLLVNYYGFLVRMDGYFTREGGDIGVFICPQTFIITFTEFWLVGSFSSVLNFHFNIWKTCL